MKVKVNNQKQNNVVESIVPIQINNQLKQKQTISQKPKKPIIKLEVNRLVKKQNFKAIQINNKINSSNHPSLPTKFSLQSFQTYPEQENQQNRPRHTTSIGQNMQKNNKSTKTFQQLYFQKLKQNKLKKQLEILPSQQTKQKSADIIKIQPSSCKNFNNCSINVHNSQKIINQHHLSKHPHSTKNAYNRSINHSITNKQNILTQNCTTNQAKQNKRHSYENRDKFFKRCEKNIKGTQNVLKELRNSKQKYKSQQKLQKVNQNNKKILKIRKSINSNQLNPHKNSTQQLNSSKQQYKQSSNSFIQNSNKSTHSQEQQKYRIKYEQFFQNKIKNIINHQSHQHVWGQTECFLSYPQFVSILQNLGIITNKIQFAFYIDKLWSNLGGHLYGGVVKYNISKFIFIIFFDTKHLEEAIIQNQYAQNYIEKVQNFKNIQCFVDQSTLKLNSLSQSQKCILRRFYYPLKSQNLNELQQFISKQPQKYTQNNHKSDITSFIQDQKTNLHKKQFIQKESQQKLKFKHQKNQQQSINNIHTQQNSYSCKQDQYIQNMSPKMNQNNQNSFLPLNPTNLVADFSPKLTKQQFQPFKSTILVKQQNKHLFDSQNLSEKQQESQQFQSLEIQNITQKPKGKPLLSVDVNLGQGNIQKLIVYEGQTPYQVSLQLKQKYNVDQTLRQKFQKLLQNHLKTLLFKIDQVCEQLFQDSREFLPGENVKRTIQ